jgi:hypothetical protein
VWCGTTRVLRLGLYIFLIQAIHSFLCSSTFLCSVLLNVSTGTGPFVMLSQSHPQGPPPQASPKDGNGSPPEAAAANGPAARPSLPDRNVTEATIEDAYVRFIFYCNPALPLYPDTQALREAFRNPPRSGGRVFSPFRVYELVTEFYQKEIKTWTELTIKLGVEPPDPAKDESTQKVAQYGVRLKVTTCRIRDREC